MAKVKDLLVNGSSRFIGKIYASDQFISQVANGTAPFVVSSSTVVANLNADMTDGLHVHTGRNNEVNKIVRTDGSGYIQTGYINTNVGTDNLAISRIFYEYNNDGYIRKMSPSSFFSVLENSGNDISITVAGQNRKLTVGYASNSDKLDGYHASDLTKFYLSPMEGGAPASSAKSWFENTMPSGAGAIVYNVPGSEKTIIVGKSTGPYGHMLQLNYDDKYLRILRYYVGNWRSDDWEKISAGYADSAGNASSAGDADKLDGYHASSFAFEENTYGTTGNFVNGIYGSNCIARGDLGLVGFDNSSITVELYEATSSNSYSSSPIKTINTSDATYGVNFRKGTYAVMHSCAAGSKLKIIVKSSDGYIKSVGIYVATGGNTISFSSTVGSTTKTGSFSTWGSWHVFSCMNSTPTSITLELNTTNVNCGVTIGGFRTYITNPNNLRFPGVSNSAESVAWDNITGKPTNHVTTDTAQTITGEKTFATNILTVSNPNGGDATLKFDRGSNTAWSIVDTGGNLKFNDLYSNTTRLTLFESSQGGYAKFADNVYSTGFNKEDSSNDYVLLGGGGHYSLNNILHGNSYGTMEGVISDCNSVSVTGIYSHSGFNNRPDGVANWGTLFNLRLYNSNNSYHRQLFFDCYSSDKIWTRSDDGGTWTSWKELITSANISSQHVSYASSAGDADTSNRTKFLETFQQNSTTNTYGSQYPIWAQWSDSTNVRLKCTNYTVWTDKANYASNAGNADKLDDIDSTGFLAWTGMSASGGSSAPFQTSVDFFNNTANLNAGARMIYNYPGNEYTILYTRRSDNVGHGSILRWGYPDNYIRMIRMISGSPQTSDWEKISAGYADSAGNSDTIDGYHYNNLPYVPKLAWHSENSGESVNDLVCGTSFYYTTHGAPTNGVVASFTGTHNSYQLQIQGKYYGKEFWYRSKNGDNGTWNAWTQVIDTNNIGLQSVTYANSAGNADTVDNKHASTLLHLDGYYYIPGNGTNSSTKLWSKIGSITFTGAWQDCGGSLTFYEWEARYMMGELKFNIRTSSSKSNAGADIVWMNLTNKKFENSFIICRTGNGTYDIYFEYPAISYINIKFYIISQYDNGYITWQNGSALTSTEPTYVNEKFVSSLTSWVGNANYAIEAGTASTANSVAWANITGKPSSFNPSSHSHPYLPTTQVVQEQNSNDDWIKAHALSTLRGHVYNTHNLEWQYLFGISSGKTYGSILRTSYGNGTPRIQVMGLTNGTWSSWREVAYDDNTVKKDGTGASGTWGISITGNAGYASSAGYADSAGNANNLANISAGNYFKHRDAVFNSEWSGKYLWTLWDNHLYAADKRLAVTLTGTTSTNFSSLFDGSFESSVSITEAKAVLHIKSTTEGNVWTEGLPYGDFYVVFYNSDAENITGRVYCNYAPQGTGWHDLAITHVGPYIWKLHNGYYQLSDLEITITKPVSSASIDLCQVLHVVERSPSPYYAAVMSKYCDQKTNYNIEAASFKKNGSSDSYVLLGGGGHKAISEFKIGDYLPLTGGTVTGPIEISTGALHGYYREGLRITCAKNNWAGITFGSTGLSGAPINGWFAALNPSDQFIISPNDSSTNGLTLNAGGDAKWRNNTIWHAGNDGVGSGLDADLLDGVHANGLFTNFSNKTVSGNKVLAATIGGKELTVAVEYAGSAGSAIYITPQSYTPTSDTVGGHKDGLVNWLNTDSATGIGKNIIISESIISQWDNDSAKPYPSSVYAMIKIGGGYNYSTYGQWLLSSYNQTRLGVVGRTGSVWSSIKWIAWTSDIPTKISQLTNDSGYITSSGSCNYANSAGNARNLLGRNTTGSDYDAIDGNLVFAEWNTYGDNRWCLKAKGFETRVGYTNDSDKLDGYHENSFYRHRGDYGKSYTAVSTDYTLGPGTYTTSESGYSGTLLSFNSSGSASAIQFWTHYSQGNLYYRTSIDSNRWGKTDGSWTRILDSDSYNYYAPTLTGSGASGTWNISISGNAATATNADTLDGYHATSGSNQPWGTIPAITTSGWMDVGRHFEFHYDNDTGSDYSTVLACTGNYSNIVNLPSKSGTLALTTDNVASATKLQNSRTIWGQSFDGTGNVSGALTEVTDITASGHAKVNSLKTQYICIECDNSGNTDGRSSEINNYAGPLYIQHNTSNNCFICSGGGNVGIGTTSPSYKLHVVGDIYTTTGFKKEGSSDSYVLLGGGGHKALSDFDIPASTTSSGITSLATGSYSSIHISTRSGGTMSFSSTPAYGKECHIIIYNSGSSTITITLPSGYRRNIGSITIASGAFGEVNVLNAAGTIYVRAV